MNSLPAKITSSYRFPRQVRLLTARQFRNVFRGSNVSQDSHYRVKAILNDKNYPRLGLAVSRRVNKHAVVRNRIKRVVRERFRLHRQALAGLDIVVVAKPAAAQADNKILSTSIDRHWQQLTETVKKGGTQTGALQDNKQ